MSKSLNMCASILAIIYILSVVDLTFCDQVHRILDCHKSKYGCCPDGVTDALGWNKEGCSSLLCYDKDKLCKEMKANGDCEAIDKWSEMSELCPKSCGRCKNQGKAASPPACYKSKYGCCYDGVTPAVSDDKRPGVGCPFCKDRYPHACKQFGHRFWCLGKFPRPRFFLSHYCFRQCGFCKNFKEMVLPKEKKDWRKEFY
ncbi:papilin-like [Actinia tenebrosa]|uniref:Papilin-like n=1 Tax=Actinia tenebrosa TaxID=6105 RepID=A0A6P8IK05_ACTTE|nr:papilin-like [Actinia tenebrosa]